MIYIASDHAGFALKAEIKKYLAELGERVDDLGPTALDPEDDYPDYAAKLAQQLLTHDGRGILLCRNAVGVCVVANKFRGIRAAVGFSEDVARTAREDDATNVLCLPADSLTPEQAKKIVEVWMKTPFSEAERHKRRIAKVAEIENKTMRP